MHSKKKQKIGILLGCLFAAVSLFSQSASGQSAPAEESWPNRPISMIIPFPPGGVATVVGRPIADGMAKNLEKPIIMENKPGAGGGIGNAYVAKAKPDGYTFGITTDTLFTINPQIYTKMPFDAAKDFVPVALGPKTPNIFTVNPSVSAKNLPELIELAKKSPFNYASSGIGTTTHLSMERLKTAAKIDIVHVPYQPAAAINAVVAGHTQIASTSMPPAVPMIKAGKLKALAVTSATRSPLLPDVPSITEYGFKEFDDYTWFGFFAPAGTPPDVINKLNAAINKAMASADVVDRFAQLGMASSPRNRRASAASPCICVTSASSPSNFASGRRNFTNAVCKRLP